MTRWKLLIVFIGLVASHSARAGNFQVSPVRVSLDERTRSVLLTLSNRGSAPVRLQVDAYRWDETTSGTPVLEATDEVVVFPSLLELAVGESRTIRVGTAAPADARERTYRIIVEEQPGASGPSNGIAIRMRLSVPIFIVNRAGLAVPRVDAPTLDAQRQLHVAIANDGTRHFKPLALQVLVTDDLGKVTTHKIAGWYVLANHRRDYVIALPAAVRCARQVKLRLESDPGLLEQTYPISDPACAPLPAKG